MMMRQLVINLMVLLVRAYRFVLRPLLVGTCRFTPTCSEYTIESLQRHGPLRGIVLSVKRISKCHPWGSSGIDLVP
jgi:putative membrane protein insertion efficiency factor